MTWGRGSGGRECGNNVVRVAWSRRAIERAVADIWNGGRPRRFPRRNVYGGRDTGRRIAAVLAEVPLDERLRRKLIAY